jgi:hypothetical protein
MTHTSTGQKKMALLPDLARLRVAPNGPKVWPILQCENVFILPGVPQFFENKMDTIVAHFLGKRLLFTRKIVLGVDGALRCVALRCVAGLTDHVIILSIRPFVPSSRPPKPQNHPELEIVSVLNEAVAAYQADVLFGSYPFYGEASPRVIVTLESQDEGRVEAAKAFLLARVRPQWVRKVADDDVLERAADAATAAAAAAAARTE